MEITIRSRFVSPRGVPMSPVLLALLGTSAGVATAATPASDCRLVPAHEVPAHQLSAHRSSALGPCPAIPAPRMLSQIVVNTGDVVALARPAPFQTSPSRMPPGSRAGAAQPDLATDHGHGRDEAVRLVPRPGTAPVRQPAAGKAPSSQAGGPLLVEATIAEMQKPLVLATLRILPSVDIATPGLVSTEIEPARLGPTAIDVAAAPSWPPASPSSTPARLSAGASLPVAAQVLPARKRAFSGSRREIPVALAAVTSPLRQSQASRLTLTKRGIEFATPALVNGANAGTVPLLIADRDNISVRLGDILSLVEPLMEKSRYEALRTSSNSGEYVTLRTLRAAGIGASMDAQDQLVLGTKARDAGARGVTSQGDGQVASRLPGPVAVGLYIDSLTESPDGSSITDTTSWTLLADTTVKKWKLSVDASYKLARGMTPSLAQQRRSGVSGRSGKGSFYQRAGLTDTRISAERSIQLARKVKLDLLTRFTLPTGQRGTERARGRAEWLVDAGVSTRVGKADVWAGAGRRFRTRGFYTPGRDITELYAGTEVAVGKKTTVRADFLAAQAAFKGYGREYSLSTGLSHRLSADVILDANVLAFRDVYGKGVQGGLTLRMPMRSF